MRKRLGPGLLMLASVAFAASVWALPASAGPGAHSSKGVVKRVSVRDNFFSPKTVRISRFGKVTWVWKGVNDHTVTFRKLPSGVSHIRGTGFKSSGSFSHVFRKRGTYRYVCRLHVALGMRGRVVVQ